MSSDTRGRQYELSATGAALSVGVAPPPRMSTLSTPARCPAALHHKGLSPEALFSADRKSDRTTNDLAIAVPVQRAAAGFV